MEWVQLNSELHLGRDRIKSSTIRGTQKSCSIYVIFSSRTADAHDNLKESSVFPELKPIVSSRFYILSSLLDQNSINISITMPHRENNRIVE